jgi:AI-2 transport protein TqsA
MEKYQKIGTICILILTVYATAAVLTFTKSVMIPFVFSIFLFLIISRAMLWLQNKFKLHHNLSLFITVFVFIITIVIVTFITSNSIDSFIKGADQYNGKIQSAVIYLEDTAHNYGFNAKQYDLKGKLKDLPLFTFLKSFTGSLISLFSNTVLIIIITLFLLTGESISKRELKTFEEIKSVIAKYAAGKILLSLATGLLSYIIFLIAGLDLALMFTMLIIFLNFIPNIGSVIAVVVPIPVLLLQFGFGWQTLFVLIVTGVIQMVAGNIIEPKMFGDSMDLHPVVILLFLAFWGFIWGIPGMLLSVPITVALKIICSRFKITSPVAEILAGRFN